MRVGNEFGPISSPHFFDFTFIISSKKRTFACELQKSYDERDTYFSSEPRWRIRAARLRVRLWRLHDGVAALSPPLLWRGDNAIGHSGHGRIHPRGFQKLEEDRLA